MSLHQESEGGDRGTQHDDELYGCDGQRVDAFDADEFIRSQGAPEIWPRTPSHREEHGGPYECEQAFEAKRFDGVLSLEIPKKYLGSRQTAHACGECEL